MWFTVNRNRFTLKWKMNVVSNECGLKWMWFQMNVVSNDCGFKWTWSQMNVVSNEQVSNERGLKWSGLKWIGLKRSGLKFRGLKWTWFLVNGLKWIGLNSHGTNRSWSQLKLPITSKNLHFFPNTIASIWRKKGTTEANLGEISLTVIVVLAGHFVSFVKVTISIRIGHNHKLLKCSCLMIWIKEWIFF